MSDYGRVTMHGDSVVVSGDGAQLWAWAHRTGSSWPCSYLAGCDLVAATLDRENGDLVALQVIENGVDSDADDLPGDELTAWADDCLAASPFAHLAKTATGMEG